MEETIKPGYVRVSTILSILPGYKDIPQEVLLRKAMVGTNVHNAIYMHNHGIPVAMTPEEQGYFDSYLQWKEIAGVYPIMQETRLYHDFFRITGCVDLFAEMGQERILIDYKTSACEDKSKWPLQAAMYFLLLGANALNPSGRALFLKLDKGGKMPKVFEYKMEPELLNAASGCIFLYNHLHKK